MILNGLKILDILKAKPHHLQIFYAAGLPLGVEGDGRKGKCTRSWKPKRAGSGIPKVA